MPLAAHFTAPVQAPGRGGARAGGDCHPPAAGGYAIPAGEVENTLVSVDASGLTAEVSGQVALTGTGTANTLWVLASAFDEAGNVVGVRRWAAAAALSAGAPVSFDFQVSSVGPAIARVEFLAEARP